MCKVLLHTNILLHTTAKKTDIHTVHNIQKKMQNIHKIPDMYNMFRKLNI